MATKVHMEALSPTMEEGQLVRWLKHEGDAVKEGDILAEIETEQVIMELVARGAGALRARLLEEGKSVPIGTVIGVIASVDEDISSLTSEATVVLPSAACTHAPLTPPAPIQYSLIPYPTQLKEGSGRLELHAPIVLRLPAAAGPVLQSASESWAQETARVLGLEVVTVTDANNVGTIITLQLDADAASNEEEGYRLCVTVTSVTISAVADAGLFYGLQTLRQLLPFPGEPAAIPELDIVDTPRLAYRGLHLDVGRHFFPVDFIKKYIDLMSRYKLNTFHWHLTDDQGWRLEILQYPRLTEVGSRRKETVVSKNFNPYVGDGTPHCGFYTQEQAREIVEYARHRFVTVIPEIEMPGHTLALLTAYPELGCTAGPFEVATHWGVFEDVLCPKEETFQFIKNLLAEVTSIFPSRYIHIGGDEVPKKRWEKSEVAQSVIQREGLKGEKELQSYFIRRVATMLHDHGRRLIGWDEILEGGLAPDATVMSWRDTADGVAAARQGHDVIMTPNSHLYFDHYQSDSGMEPLAIGGNLSLEKVYSFEPVPAELTAEQARHILGAQANVWTEYMKTCDHVEYMVFPRLLALAEVVWSPRQVRNWQHFQRRLPTQLQQLDQLNVRYRPLK